jgi:hypothetical protein
VILKTELCPVKILFTYFSVQNNTLQLLALVVWQAGLNASRQTIIVYRGGSGKGLRKGFGEGSPRALA